jgi:hypothetical protein
MYPNAVSLDWREKELLCYTHIRGAARCNKMRLANLKIQINSITDPRAANTHVDNGLNMRVHDDQLTT